MGRPRRAKATDQYVSDGIPDEEDVEEISEGANGNVTPSFVPDVPEAEEEAEASKKPAKRKAVKRKRGRPRKKVNPRPDDADHDEDEEEVDDVLIIENGVKMTIPAKHTSPIQHSRPKRRGVIKQKMTINVNARSMGDGPESELPSAPIYIEDSCSVSDVKDAIYAACSYLPPITQKLFCKNDEGEFVELDAEGLESLKDLGLSLPGPHDIWLQYNLEHMFPAVDPASVSQQQLKDQLPGSPAKTPSQLNPALQQKTTIESSPSPPEEAAPAKAATPPTQPRVTAAAESEPNSQTHQEATPPAQPAGRDSVDTGVVRRLEEALPGHTQTLAAIPAPPLSGSGSGQQAHQSRRHPEAPSGHGASPQHYRPGGGRQRKNKRWTDEEIEHLLLGLMKFGLSSWTEIASHWRFEDRTTVDLKDKWRNLVKNVRDGRQMRGMSLTEEAKSRIWRIMRENGVPLGSQGEKPSNQVHPNPLPTEEVS